MYTMEEIFVKKEPEEPFDDSEDGISINYSTPSTSAGPLTSGIAIKQEIKEELNDSHNFMIYDESGVKKESEVSTDKENDLHGSKQVQPKFKGKDKMFLDSGSKINDSDEESDNSGNGDESEDFSCNIKEEGWDSDFTEDDTNLLHNEENNEDKAMFGTKIKVEYHGIQYDESGIDSEDVNKEIPEKIVLPKAGKEKMRTKERERKRAKMQRQKLKGNLEKYTLFKKKDSKRQKVYRDMQKQKILDGFISPAVLIAKRKQEASRKKAYRQKLKEKKIKQERI
ncbi:unnamed protein product [Brassicogethes aeneus]|uniref:Uncharacterized protein n=1 Tax=Brassicogethes aeneus TaxID=1431903 RepID=A0A9P0AU77_BRAAE|nr:unnamed protein product [Brassicogethes aeneus]